MTSINRSSPIYIVRPDPEDGVYDADPAPSEGHLGEQMFTGLLGQLMRGMPGTKDVGNQRPSSPGLPGGAPTPGGAGFSAPAAYDYDQNEAQEKRSRRHWPYFFFFTEAPAGGFFCTFYVPRKIIFSFFFIIFLVASAIPVIPGLGEFLVNLIK